MNEPIINPWVLYLCDVVPGLKVILVALLMVCLGLIAVCGMLYFYGVMEDTEATDVVKKVVKKPIIAAIILAIVTVVISSKDTMYAMYITSMTTPSNIEIVGDSAKDMVDYLAEQIKEINEEDL